MKAILFDGFGGTEVLHEADIEVPQPGPGQIRVRVKRPGLQVRARKGYWALSPDDVAAVNAAATRVGPAPEIADALGQIETPLRARTIRTWIGTARGENGRTAVTLVWEPAPAAAGDHLRQRQLAPGQHAVQVDLDR